MYAAKIKLIGVVKAANSYGDLVDTETVKTVFAETMSIGQNEFYQANATGFRPEIKFIIPNFWEYSGEEQVEWTPFMSQTPVRYHVIRTYQNGQNIELTCQRGVEVIQDANTEESD